MAQETHGYSRRDSADQSFQSCENSIVSDEFPEEIIVHNDENIQKPTPKSRFSDISQLSDEETLAMQTQALLEWILGIEWVVNEAEIASNPVILNHFTAFGENLFSRNLDGAREVKRSCIRKGGTSKASRYGVECSLTSKCSISLSLFLKTVGANNPNNPDEITWLSFGNAELLAILIVRSLLVNERMGFLEKLFEISSKTHKMALDRHIATSRLYKILAGRGLNLNDSLADMRQCLTNHCTLPLVCPELYEGIKPLTPTEVTESLWITASSTPPRSNVCQLIIQALEDNELIDHESILIGLCDRIFAEMKGRRIHQLQSNASRALGLIATIPTVAKLLVYRSYWLIEEEVNNRASDKVPLGWRYMGSTLLGRVFQASPMDSMRQGDETKEFTPTIELLFKPLIPKGTVAAHNPTPVQERLRNSIKGVINDAVTFVKAMLKHGGEVRNRTVQWFALVLEANSKFASLDFRHHHRFFARLPPIFFMPLHVSMGLCTIGFGFNVIWTLLELCRPITLSKIVELDPLWPHWCRIESTDGGFLGSSIKSEPHFIDDESLKTLATDLCRVRPLGDGQVKFPTQIFWLTLKGIRIFLFPAIADYEWKHQVLVNAGREEMTQRDAPREDLLAECLAWSSLLACDRVMDAFSHFSELACGVFLHSAFGFTHTGDICQWDQGDLMAHPILQLVKVPKLLKASESAVSPQFACMPLRFYSDFFETISKFILNTSSPLLTSQQKLNSDIENWMIESNCELFAAALLLILNDRSILIRNSGFKLEAAAYNMTAISVTQKFRNRMQQTFAYSTALASALVTAFSQAQKLSYYMRIELRLILTRELKDQLMRPEFRNQIADVSISQKEDFEKFLHFLASNTNWVIEEALTQLSEIKKREAKYGPTGIPPVRDAPNVQANMSQNTTAATNGQEESAEDNRIAEEIEGGRNVSEMPFDDLVSQCKGLMEAGSISLVVFNSFDSRIYNFILQSDVLLPQMLLCINGCLDSLVGPRCMALKVSNFEKYNFKPRDLLSRLSCIYVAFIGNRTLNATDIIVKELVNETRFFKIGLFTKALRIIKREGLADAKTTRRFDELVTALSEAVSASSDSNHDESLMADIPDEYLDPIMAEIMLDPVRLPPSGVICDRKVIERHLIGEEFDPFNRAPLTKADLIPEDNLREAIQQFLAQRQTKRS